MSYTPTEWEPTDVVTATRMNALEQAVGDMNMSYTPNTWSDGDILSAEKMNALEQAVASGGGGSSDFSLAKLSIAVNGAGASNVAAVQVSNICTSISSTPDSTTYYEADIGLAIIYNNPDPYLNILIGGGATTFGIPDDVIAMNMQQQPLTISNITFSGDAEVQTESGYSWVEIMGDCTMTITIS